MVVPEERILTAAADELRRCSECETVFEADVADAGQNGPRCPQCGLTASVPVLELDDRDFVIRKTTPFR
jgi:uncharacterized paraquat-inducible protein A